MNTKSNHPLSLLSLLILTSIVIVAGCTSKDSGNADSAEDTNPTPMMSTPEPKITSLEEDIAEMRTAGIDNIFTIKKKDGSAFDGEDRQFLRANIPVEVNRVISSDDGRTFVVGSTFIIPQENVDAWKSRFEIQNRTEKEKK